MRHSPHEQPGPKKAGLGTAPGPLAEESPPAATLGVTLAVTPGVLTTVLRGQKRHTESLKNLSDITKLIRIAGGIQTQFWQPLESTL